MNTPPPDIKILGHGWGCNGTRLWHLFEADNLEKALDFRDGVAAQCHNAEILLSRTALGIFTMRTIFKKSV